MDFADDIALISEDKDKANEFLLIVESAAASVGLHINEGKTKVMTLNMEERSNDLQSRSGEAIGKVDDFIYLGSWIESTDREIRVRKGNVWGALHRLKDIWKFKRSTDHKPGHWQRLMRKVWMGHKEELRTLMLDRDINEAGYLA